MGIVVPADVLRIIKECVGRGDIPTSLHQPSFSGREWDYVKDCLDTGWVSSVGSYVDRFEHELASFTGIKHVVAVMNGTAALHIAIRLAGVNENDEVLVPTLTFVASVNAIINCNAVPHFVDCNDFTLGVDPLKLEEWLTFTSELRNGVRINRTTGRRIAALIVVHIFGHPALLDDLSEVCQKFGLALIEDAAESIGSYYKGKHTGHWGKLSTMSFNGNKTITTGGGGAILTNDESLARMAKHLTTTAKVKHPYKFFHDQAAFNYRLPNINAAIGCAQMEQLSKFLAQKRALASRYIEAFAQTKGLKVLREPEQTKSNYWLNAIVLDTSNLALRDEILDITNRAGVQTRPVWELMHTLPMFGTCPRMELKTSEQLYTRIINIPSSQSLMDNMQ